MIKVSYIISSIDKAPFFEKIFQMSDKSRFDISVLLLNPGKSALENYLNELNIKHHRITYRGKKDYLKALFGIYRFLRKTKPDIVHAHLIDAGLIGLSAAWLAGIKTRVYTKHGGSQRIHVPRGVKHDKAINKLATHIIATCNNGKEILMEEEHVAEKKITIINLAFDFDELEHNALEKTEELQQRYNPHKKAPVIGVISRWVEWKGIQYILPAFRELLKTHPDALLILANARGEYQHPLTEYIQELGESVRLIPFDYNTGALYRLFDIFIHVPTGKRFEAFGQIYVEALAMGIPSVFTKAGIADEIIEDEHNALVVEFQNSAQILDAIKKILDDRALQASLKENGKNTIKGKFAFTTYLEKLECLYETLYDK